MLHPTQFVAGIVHFERPVEQAESCIAAAAVAAATVVVAEIAVAAPAGFAAVAAAVAPRDSVVSAWVRIGLV